MRKTFALAVVLAAGWATCPGLAAERPSPAPSAAALTPDQLFSRRALRRARVLIQMRLLQLHDERLECVRAALLRRLPVELRPDKQAGSAGQFDTICDFFPLRG
jgi:hypothetical protein